jgi:predicted SprT family Zn-dependent metalloprotease
MKRQSINEIAQSIWDAYCEIYPQLVKFDCPTIKLCNRLTKTIGKCYYWENRIHLGNKFFVRNRAIMLSDILPHEIAHQVSYCLYGAEKQGKECHGIEWQEIMLSYGLFPHVTYAITL